MDAIENIRVFPVGEDRCNAGGDRFTTDDECTVDVGYEITDGGEKRRVWIRPQEVVGYIEKLREEIRLLKETNSSLQKSNQAFATNTRTFHNCRDGKVKPYPFYLCSSCPLGSNENGKDFDAVNEIEKLRKENSELKDIEKEKNYYKFGGEKDEKAKEIHDVGDLRRLLLCSDNEEPIYFVLDPNDDYESACIPYIQLKCTGASSSGGGRITELWFKKRND